MILTSNWNGFSSSRWYGFLVYVDASCYLITTLVFNQGDDPEAFMTLLDQADRLCSFNGVRFDIPFIQACFKASNSRVSAWRRKLHDIFEGCKLSLDITFPLSALLKKNNLAGKNGNGADAILLAKNQEWDKLGGYCINDTKMTHAVSSLQAIWIPGPHGLFMNFHGDIKKKQ